MPLHLAHLRQSDPQTLMRLLDCSRDLVAVFDHDDRLEAANLAYCRSFCCDLETRPFWHDTMRANYFSNCGPVIESDDIEEWLLQARARRGKVSHRSFEAEMHGNKWILVTETVAPDGRMLFYGTDITAVRTSNRILRQKLGAAQRAAATDPLTGVPNRRYVMDQLEAWHEAQVTAAEFGEHSLAVVDLDNFKKLNDTYGHSIGDEVLRLFSRQAVNGARLTDLFGRIGGEEFLFFFPNCSVEVAQFRISTLQSMALSFGAGRKAVTITCTFSGGVVRVRADQDIHDAIRAADKLLYHAKNMGRARVIINGP
ncbi:diguanylate cyclase (GGDEF) domain-containing protein [Paracoccus tibetensis]|uniref:diguanylate cyclase n=1 Tax=Paracoccus tibetensis TaxID=336292 RepID=A0A1G5DRU9_9RHOB|nr:diguanylate cyclase (GGDEF) domain-containing protein [Paracoccus tibetensis]